MAKAVKFEVGFGGKILETQGTNKLPCSIMDSLMNLKGFLSAGLVIATRLGTHFKIWISSVPSKVIADARSVPREICTSGDRTGNVLNLIVCFLM